MNEKWFFKNHDEDFTDDKYFKPENMVYIAPNGNKIIKEFGFSYYLTL